MTRIDTTTAPTFGIAVFEDRRETIACTPIARQLMMSHPDATIVWFTTAACAAALENNPWIHEVVVLDGQPATLYAQLDDLRSRRPWTEFYAPSWTRNHERLPGLAEWEVVSIGSGVSWIVPFVFVVELTKSEVDLARRYWDRLPTGPKILIEAEGGHPCTGWSPDWLSDVVDALAPFDPTIVLTDENPPPYLYELRDRWPKTIWCREPFRLNAEFVNLCDLLIGNNGEISALSYSTHCRRNVPHIEFAASEASGAASLRHPEDTWQCFDRARFREALSAIAARWSSEHDTPVATDFAPRHPRRAGEHQCPACGDCVPADSHAGFLSCEHCQLAFADREIDTAIQPPASESVAARAQRIAARVEHLRCAVETWRGAPPRSALLEIGCRGGELLRAARARGFGTAGLTHDLATLQELDATELGICHGNLETGDLPTESFGIVMLSHELPRHAYPTECLERAQHLVEPGGILYLTLPNYASVGHMTQRENWTWLGSDRLACHPTISYFRRVCAQLGLAIETIETTPGEFDPDELMALFRNIKPGTRDEVLHALIQRCCQSSSGEELRVVLRKRGTSKARRALQVDWGAADRVAAARRAKALRADGIELAPR